MSKTGALSVQVKDLLDEYSKDLARATNDAIDEIAKEALSMVKQNSVSQFGSGPYSKGWRLKREKTKARINTVILHNKDHYQLTHLLENGHIITNAYGTYGRTKAHPHIKPVEEWAQRELPAQIEREAEQI